MPGIEKKPKGNIVRMRIDVAKTAQLLGIEVEEEATMTDLVAQMSKPEVRARLGSLGVSTAEIPGDAYRYRHGGGSLNEA